jgi:beta-lactamase regulating signal transducer with metallopeptidase domain
MRADLSRQLLLLPPLLVDAALRGAVVLLAALVLTWMLRRRSASTRHAIWVGAIVAQLLLLVLSTWGPRWRVAAPDAVSALVPAEVGTPPEPRPVATRVETDRGQTPKLSAPTEGVWGQTPKLSAPTEGVRGQTPVLSTPAGPAPVAAPRVSGRTLLAMLWALGAHAVLVRLAVGTTIVARLARRGDRIDDGGWLSLAQRLSKSLGIQRPLILMRGDRLAVPITWGIVYPVVLLPDEADGWPEERRRFVLVHEMAHVKRLDALTQLVGQVALALFWFDPLVWLATRRMQLEREHACDDYVLRHGTEPSQYATELLEMVRALGTPTHRGAQPAFAALAMARRSEFEGRMLSILDPVLDRHPLSRGRTLMSALASLLVVVPLAALQPYRPAAQTLARSSSPVSVESSSARVSATAADSHVATGSDRPLAQRVSALDSARTALGARVEGFDGARATMSAAATGAASASAARSSTKDDDSCDAARLDGRQTSTHVHSDDDDHSGSDIRYLDLGRGRCMEARIFGKYEVSENEDEVVSVGPASRVYLRERTATGDRSVEYAPAASGSGLRVARTYRVNGVETPFDEEGRRFVARLLPSMLAELSINVPPRVARWRAQGGVDNALHRISDLRSSGAKRAHFEALLAGRLTSDEAERLVKQAGREVASSGDLRSVLSKAAPQIRVKAGSAAALEDAFAAVASSGDRTAVLQDYGQTNDRDMLLTVMRIAKTIPSSGDKANLLTGLTARYLGANDRALREAFFAAAVTIPSSGDLANVLGTAVPFAAKSTDVALAVIDAASHIASSGDRSNVLVALADAGAVKTSATHDAYLGAAKDIPSSGDMRRVLEAITRH